MGTPFRTQQILTLCREQARGRRHRLPREPLPGLEWVELQAAYAAMQEQLRLVDSCTLLGCEVRWRPTDTPHWSSAGLLARNVQATWPRNPDYQRMTTLMLDGLLGPAAEIKALYEHARQPVQNSRFVRQDFQILYEGRLVLSLASCLVQGIGEQVLANDMAICNKLDAVSTERPVMHES